MDIVHIGIAHQDSKHVVPHDKSQVIDLHGNQLSDRHHFVVHYSVPLYILHLHREGHQVGALQPTALRECVGAGALEIKLSAIKGEIVGVTRGVANTLTDRVTFLDTILYFTFLIRATRELLTFNLRIEEKEKQKCVTRSRSNAKL